MHPAAIKGDISNYWIIKGEPKLINKIENEAPKYNFQSRRWWEFGCHKMPTFARIKTHNLDNTNQIAESTLGLPFHLFMGEKEFEHIHKSLKHMIGLDN